MDPITAFSLVASILQVIDVSFKAVSKCREIYKDGSLAENQSTAEITKYLDETTCRLKTSLQNAPCANSQASTDIIDISTKCSKTAAELLAELEKMRFESGGGRRQAIVKGIRALRRNKFVADSQEKLETYQRVLDTRILVGLNSHSIQQVEGFQSLDQSVKDLATALDQGHNTVTRLVADQNSELREHIDRRLDDQACIDQKLKAQIQFRESLFFPEMFSRQDDIRVAHEGTCRWIFAKGQPWPSLAGWFEQGDEPYWLSGKPGSGKSTLMKYITEEFRAHLQRENALTSEIVTASFFFWNPGSALQKNITGFLRSLLYQIADQRPDLIPIMSDQQVDSTRTPNINYHPTPLYAWTEHRLKLVLRRLLTRIPPTINLYVFIDGLDELDGDEDDLMSLVCLLNQFSRAKVCVSSRPEQIFRQGFARSPQIKLQDLNFSDMKKAAEDRLYPTLVKYFPGEMARIDKLIRDTIQKAQGVFLWLELMTKSLKKGACNADTMDELYEKLNGTPETIDGLYQHMLDSLDKSYSSQAFRYFGRLIWSEERSEGRSPPNLLNFVFAESELSKYVPWNNREYFTSPEFMHHCLSVETRILTRCAGLVEIQECGSQLLNGLHRYDRKSGTLHDLGDPADPDNKIRLSPDEQNPSRHYYREVRFIHKTVGDFLRNRHGKLFRDPDELSTAAFALVRGQLGVMNLIPIMESQSELGQNVLTSFSVIEGIMDDLIKLEQSEAVQNTDHAFENTIFIIVNQMYRDIECIAALNGPAVSLSERYKRSSTGGGIELDERIISSDRRLPFHDASGFAAFFGCQSQVLHNNSLHDCSHKHLDYLLACTITGFQLLPKNIQLHRVISSFTIIRELLHQGASWDSTSYVEPELWADNTVPLSAWTAFLSFVVPAMYAYRLTTAYTRESTTNRDPKQLARAIKVLEEIVTFFLSDRADVNSSIFSTIQIFDRTRLLLLMALEETPLSLIRVSVASRGPNPLRILNDMLRSHGGLERRRGHFIRIEPELWGSLPEEYNHLLRQRWYRLSQTQSDCLCDILHSNSIHYNSFWIQPNVHPENGRRIKEVLLGLTESDLVVSPDDRARSIDKSASTNSDGKSSEDEVGDGFAERHEDDFGGTIYEDKEDISNEGADNLEDRRDASA